MTKHRIKTMKKVIRLTESDIHRIVKNSVKRILKESLMDNVMCKYIGFCNDEELDMNPKRTIQQLLRKGQYEQEATLSELYEKYGEFSVAYEDDKYIAFSSDGMDVGCEVWQKM